MRDDIDAQNFSRPTADDTDERTLENFSRLEIFTASAAQNFSPTEILTAGDIVEREKTRAASASAFRLDSTPPRFFYGVQGTPFINAAEAWFWTLDCLEARAEGSRGCSALRVGRPCDPDDVVNALRRLDLPATHARTVVAWGKRREVPPAKTEARSFWDEAMGRLKIVLRAKGIIRPTDHELIDLMAQIGDDDRLAATRKTRRTGAKASTSAEFAPDFRMIVGTGGSRAAVKRAIRLSGTGEPAAVALPEPCCSHEAGAADRVRHAEADAAA